MTDFILAFDKILKTIFPSSTVDAPMSPASTIEEAPLSAAEKSHVGGLMRVNHAGEVCAQALYRGQAMVARSPDIKQHLLMAAAEEEAHLAWCESRLNELGEHTSYLDPAWALGAFMIGLLAGATGDKWSLGFVAETERQVGAHLHNHLSLLPLQDKRTHAIIAAMHQDELSHVEHAMAAGGALLPKPIVQLMGWASQVMTRASYYL